MSDFARDVVRHLIRFANVVLEGPPGTGKTHAAREVAQIWEKVTGRQLGGPKEGPYAITMHPSTAYEDFVEGLRYDDQTNQFTRRNGFIRQIVHEAEQNPDLDFLVLLDELNRSNVPKVLGDLLLTMEGSKRSHWNPLTSAWEQGTSVTLPYSQHTFSMPSNVYILATMNTSDRSIAPLDVALRRRFAFVRVEPVLGDDLRKLMADQRGSLLCDLMDSSIEILTDLNQNVLTPVLGPDGQLGHSYLLDVAPQVPLPLHLLCDSGIKRAFWMEVRSGNGGSKNQLDLADSGAGGNPGSVTLFYPLTASPNVLTAPDPRRKRADSLDVFVEGKRYSDNVVRWNDPTPGWRLYLQGIASDGSRLSATAGVPSPTSGRPGASFFEYSLHIWSLDANDDFHLHTIETTNQNLAVLKSLSIWHDRTQASNSGRAYGSFDLSAVRAHCLLDEPRSTWRYVVLPQLVEYAVTHSVEDLFDEEARESWQSANGEPADSDALERFDEFLAELKLGLRVVGHGLGRTLMIADAE